MIQCLVIDDEPFAGDLLSDYITKTPGLELVSAYTNPIEALHFIEDHKVDLIFLDIQMPELTGLQFLKISKGKIPVILTTAYEKYALSSYDFDVIDYLLKPIDYERFLISVSKFNDRFKKALHQTKDQMNTYIFVKSEYKSIRVDFDDIYFIEGLRDYAIIHTQKGKVITLETLKHLLNTLPHPQFARVHKSYIVAISKIDIIERNEIQINKVNIPIGETFRKKFFEIIQL